MTSRQWTAKAEGTLMPIQRGRFPGLPWLPTGWPWACTPNTSPVYPPFPSSKVNAPSPRLLSWLPVLPRANCVPVMMRGPAVKHSGMFVGVGVGSALTFGLMVLAIGIVYLMSWVVTIWLGSHLEPPETALHILTLAGGKAWRGETKTQKHQCFFLLWFLPLFPLIWCYQLGPAELQLKNKPLLFKVPILCLAPYETETLTLSLTWGACLPA